MDELHTSWVTADSLDDVAPRAAIGNQLPLYFWGVWSLVQLFGQSEFVLRGPSLVAWCCSLILGGIVIGVTLAGRSRRPDMASPGGSATYSRLESPGVAVLAFFILAGLDRIQTFYATESRPYALMQLFALGGWVSLFLSMERPTSGTNRVTAARGNYLHLGVLAWTACSLIAVHLHLTAALAIAPQAVGWLAVARTLSRPGPVLISWCLGVAILGLSVLPFIDLVETVWGHRAQWNALAGDSSFAYLLRQLPVLPWLVPAGVAWSISAMVGTWRGNRSPGFQTESTGHAGSHLRPIALWSFAAAAPVAAAWGLTASGIAPLTFSRYLVSAEIPLCIVAVLLFDRIDRRWLRTVVFSSSLLWMLVSQGTLDLWRNGQVIGWLRGEDWRSASRWISTQWRPDDRVCCWSGLIEGNRVQVPVQGMMREYLSFPLRGIYRPHPIDPNQNTDPIPLIGKPQQWIEQWRAEGIASNRCWIVYRGYRQRLSDELTALQRIAAAEGWTLVIIGPPQPMGKISAACVQFSRHDE